MHPHLDLKVAVCPTSDFSSKIWKQEDVLFRIWPEKSDREKKLNNYVRFLLQGLY